MKYLIVITSILLLNNCIGVLNPNKSTKDIPPSSLPTNIGMTYIPLAINNNSDTYLKIAKDAFSKKYPSINLNDISSGSVSQLSNGRKIHPEQAIKVSWIKFKEPISQFGGVGVEEQAEVLMNTDHDIFSIRYKSNK
jgi:hypothetical protein